MKEGTAKERREAFLPLGAHDGAAAAEEMLAALDGEDDASVVLGGVDALAILRSLGAQQALVAEGRAGKGRRRLVVLVALERQRTPEVTKLLLEVAAGKDLPAAAQAVLGLATDRPLEGFPILLQHLKGRSWQLRAAAARTLAAYADKDALLPLAEALGAAEGRDRADLLRALETISGQAFGYDVEAWRRLAAGEDPASIPKKPVHPPSFLGVPVYGERVVLVVDNSLEMGDPHELDRDVLMRLCEPPDGNPIAWFRLKTFAQLAHAHVVHLAGALPSSARFEVLFFNERLDPVFGKLSPSNGGTMRTLEEKVAGLETDNGVATYEALDAALDVAGAGDEKAWRSGPDEILFVTSNLPRTGEVVEAESVYAAIALKARLRMVPVHAFVLNYHCPQCPALAERTGGTYHLIPPQAAPPAGGG
jgi:hypothetical protein